MNRSEKAYTVFVMLFMCSVIAMICYKSSNDIENTFEEIISRDTIIVRDTVIVTVPEVKDSIVVRYKVVTMPCLLKHYADSCCLVHDTVDVILPIEQKRYEGECYEAWVSGYESSLDSIRIEQQTVTIETERTIKEKRKRWVCVAGIGAGVGNYGISPMVGVTIGYRLY